MIKVTKKSLGFKFCCPKCGCEGTFEPEDFKANLAYHEDMMYIHCPQCPKLITSDYYDIKEHRFDTWSGDNLPDVQDLKCGVCGKTSAKVTGVECAECSNVGIGNDYCDVVEDFTYKKEEENEED